MKAKLLIRWATVLCLATTWFGQTLSALALTPEQIQQKLQEIPVFTITNDKGEILLAAGKNEKKSVVLFISKEEAQKSIHQLKQKNPSQPLQVMPISLGRMYQTIRENQADPQSPLMSLVPIPSELTAAQQLLGSQQQFQGVPLFYATIKIPPAPNESAGKPQEAYLTAPDNKNNPMIPFYFEKETIQKLVEDFKKAQPEQASNIQIRVVPLESLLTAFERNDNATEEKAKENMVIVPSRESIQFIQNLPSEPAPAATPPKKK
jgi:nickel transport protein